ncbi:L-threonine 3-dehydrogenase [Petrotoga mexicana DSM 14811]|uniref:L-threonine 3-dehydrogenase n=1 Tax=Petrotoga mexicana DSM 14811 TaxID=1122954 RepID=A0A2K1PBN5_9BACT|nr:L-threonine 3-dehydrogenase [Petrotoga mexicana]PNS00205.1 L-threonine 3-dehydrogenase [Petrotoga mexicana DSM 14811]
MKAIVKSKPGKGLSLVEVEEPILQSPHDVKIKILKVSICGTDVHIYEWNDWAKDRIKHFPQIDGHEFVGRVIEVGNEVKNVKSGDLVVSDSHIPCGYCYQCRTGNMHVCQNLEILGVDRDGVFSEYTVLPDKVLIKIDEGIPLKYASVMEPLGNAIFTTTAADLRGKVVLIAGAGPIGAMAIEIAKLSGAAYIVVSEPSDYRINMAKSLGADLVINPKEKSVVEEVLKITSGLGADVFLEMSGNENALNEGIKSLKSTGVASILGVYPESKVKFEMNTAVFKNLTIHTITGRKMFETWYMALNWLKYRKLDLSKVVTHEFDFENFEEAFELMASGKSGKIVLNVTKEEEV